MSFLLFVYVFVVGCCVGSFLNVLIYRLPLDLEVVIQRSHCPYCKHELAWREMIPIVSYLRLQGKCSVCHEKLSLRYPVIEGVCGILAVAMLYDKGCTLEAVISFLAGVILLGISCIDYVHMIIPDSLNGGIAVLGVLHHVLVLRGIVVSDLVVGVCVVLFMIGMNYIVEDAFGGGDIKLIMAASLLIGNRMGMAICVASTMACVYASYLWYRGKIDSRSHIPFGPFLAFGIWVCMM
ncbi:MAG: prepilin peptidase [Erysipelotrichaceae bacterium]|nr:prepilin peptidase [Erysipelotrichaceae bacterium]